MAIVINGSGTVTGISVGGLPDDIVDSGTLANDVVVSTSGAITTTGAFTSIGIDDNADANAITIDSSEDVTVSVGNLVIGTAGKGIDFSAQTATATGTTASEVLDHYEEGTWTASLSGTTETLGTATGYYTRIGDVVFVGWYSNSTTLASSTGSAVINGLPFSSNSKGGVLDPVFNYTHGNAVDGDSRGGFFDGTTMRFGDNNGTAGATFIDGAGKYIMVSGFYYV